MNYTENYHLPQWVKTDRIMMDDFNDAMAGIEAGMTENAQAAQQAAQLPYVVGSYTGDGVEIRDFYLGFRPSFVIICGKQLTSGQDHSGMGMAMAGPTVDARRIIMTDTGFQLDISDTLRRYPDVNANGSPYNYIAFR